MDSRRTRGQITAIACAVAVTFPGLFLRVSGAHGTAWVQAIVFGLAVVGRRSLAWAAEALQLDVSQGLALAVLALIAVLPEYAVDFAFTCEGGTRPREVRAARAGEHDGRQPSADRRRLVDGGAPGGVADHAASLADDGYEGEIDDRRARSSRPHSIEIALPRRWRRSTR